MNYNAEARTVIQKVFPGKAGLNRAFILEGLLLGSGSTSELARFIAGKTKGNYKHIYSVIDRKQGPLQWLNQKDFIAKELEGWELTFKGMSFGLVLIEDVGKVLPMIKNQIVEFNKSELKDSLEELGAMPIFKDFFKPNVLTDFVKTFSGHDFWDILRTRTLSFINKGLNIADLSSQEFKNILVSQVFSEMANKKIFKAFMSRKVFT
jgi:hypothetical protein